MTALPPALEASFAQAAAELGMCGASRLFVRELSAAGGDELVRAARERLGRVYPVLDQVSAQRLAGVEPAPPDPARLLPVLEGVTRLLVVGLEAEHLDALVPRLAGVELGLLTAGELPADWSRILANLGGRVAPVSLTELGGWAGRRSALLTFVYGADEHVAHVPLSWLRVAGPDVRTQYRTLLGWDVLGSPMYVYPRWLAEAARSDFSAIVP